MYKCFGIFIIHIFIHVLVSTAIKNVPNLWAVMKRLEDVNRRSIQQRPEPIEHSDNTIEILKEPLSIVDRTSQTFSGQTSEKSDIDISVTTKLPGITIEQNKKQVFPSVGVFKAKPVEEIISDQTSTLLSVEKGLTDSVTQPTPTKENPRKPSVNPKPANPVSINIDSRTKSILSEHVSKKTTGRQAINDQRSLIYAGVASGAILAVLFVVLMISIRRKRHNRRSKERFSTTDQRTYRDTKIFVMANSEKTNNILCSFNAIPSDTFLWKELKTSTPNVF